MAAEEILTWDVAAVDGGARRPSIADVGDALLEDDPAHPPPNDGTHLYAKMVNQWAKQIAALGRTASSVRMTIAFDGGGVPFIDRLEAAGTLIVTSTFTLTDNGNGDTTIAWDPGDLPAITCEPIAGIVGTGNFLTPTVEVVSATSIRVRTPNSSGTLTNQRVTIRF